jgi:hypothetical protein
MPSVTPIQVVLNNFLNFLWVGLRIECSQGWCLKALCLIVPDEILIVVDSEEVRMHPVLSAEPGLVCASTVVLHHVCG